MSMSQWPRDVRDTWLLLGLIGWTVLPHLLRQPLWLAALCVGVLLWRGWLARRQAPLPGRWALLALLLLAALLTWRTQRTLLGRDAGVILLVCLMALKTLEMRAQRDAMLLFFLGFFLVLTNFLYSQSLAIALGMLLAAWGWLTALTLAHMPVGYPSVGSAARLAVRTTAWGAPVMLALFLLFPRLAPLWATPGDAARTGLSDRMRPGDVAELAQDDSIALRLKFSGNPPPLRQLYLRGPVLVREQDGTWLGSVSRPVPDGDTLSLQLRGQPADYEITLEPGSTRWLPLLEWTPSVPSGVPGELAEGLRLDSAGQWTLRAPSASRLRLQARAWPLARLQGPLDAREARAALALPGETHQRTREWARQFIADAGLQQATPRQWADALLRHIRQENFRYTLAPGPYEADMVDEFWLERRAGFCEHYATAFTVIMRSLGVPARIVTGYQGADPQPVDGYLVVRQSNAHAWSEIWVADEGWVRIDPTAAVAPERIERGSALRPAPGVVAGALDQVSPGLRQAVQAWLEGLDNRWNQWVLGYGRQDQLGLLERLGLESPDVATLGRVIAVLLGLAALAGSLWVWLDTHRRSPWQRLQARILDELDRLDVPAEAHEGLGTLAERLRRRHGPTAEAAAQALLELQAWRYGPPVAGTPQPRETWNAWQRRFLGLCRPLRPAARRRSA